MGNSAVLSAAGEKSARTLHSTSKREVNLAPQKSTTQTVRIAGQRMRLTTRNGRVTARPAPVLEWELQAAQIRALRAMPEYGKQFLLVGGMESGKRGPRAQQQALATGLTAGHPDVTIFMAGGRCAFIENKVGNGRLSPAQVERHASLVRIGHTVVVLRATTTEDAAAQAVALVRQWLAGNCNNHVDKVNKSA